MSDVVPEPVSFDEPPGRPKHGRQVVAVVIAVVLVLGGAGVVGIHVGWFGGDPEAATGIADPLPSTSRALAAAIVAHVPADVTVVWSSGSDSLPEGFPPGEAGALLRDSVTSFLLLRRGSDEFFLWVIANPGESAVPGALGDGLITKDKSGHPVNEMLAASAHGSSMLISESASPTSSGDLPFSTIALKAMADDPLVGMHTDAATLARSKTLARYLDKPPALTWEA